MTTTQERLSRFASPTPSRWRENAEARLANQDERRKARRIATSMLDAMEMKDISESGLAIALGTTGSELSSILKGHSVPSIKLASAIETVLGITIMQYI